MISTSDTEFYSLSLNSLAPPPYSTQTSYPALATDVESATCEKHEQFSRSFVRRLTPPFLRTASHLPNETEASPSTSVWIRLEARLKDWVINWWLCELFSWLISALCIFGLALLLSYWDGRAVPDRWPSGITLNAYIAILSGITKYTLAVPIDSAIGQLRWQWFAKGPRPLIDFEHFDDASRGPLGAAKLILLTKGRTIASIGAIITILSLAMDPFFQQLVALPKRPSSLLQSAVPRMVNFTIERNSWLNNSTAIEETIAPDRPMEDALFSFMLNNGTLDEIHPFCPSETCVWKPFDTLAMCSSCTDVSSLLTLACLEESGEWRRNATVNGTEPSRTLSCGYFLNATSENPILMSGYAVNTSNIPNSADEILLMRNFNLHDVNVDQIYWGGSLNYQEPGFPLVDFIQVVSPDAASVLDNKPPVARECAIRWCTQRVVASYEEGHYTEQILSEGFDTSPPFDALDITDDMVFTYYKNISISPDGSDLVFSVSNETILPTIFMFQNYFPAYLTTVNETDLPLFRTHNVVDLDSKYWPYPYNPFVGDASGQDYIKNMTRTITNNIRMNSHSSEFFMGSGGMETYIKVRWEWIALPLALVLLTLVLLLSVILSSRKDGSIGIWKSSVLAALVNGFSDSVREQFGASTRLSDIFERSAQIRVQLRQGKDGDGDTFYLDDRQA